MFVTVKLLQLNLQRLVLTLRKPYFMILSLRYYSKERDCILGKMYKGRFMKEI